MVSDPDEYIKCKICKSTKTLMERNKNSRMLETKCEDCHSRVTVKQIKSALAAIKK